MSAQFCGCDPEASWTCERHRDNTHVRCLSCAWAGRGFQLVAQACPLCDGRVTEESEPSEVSQ